MTQTLHIFRKDTRYLWREIALLVLLAILFAAGWAQFVFIIGALVLIARVVHAEAIPGDRQFWLTRPYERRSLLFAKLLFILVWVGVPVGLAQLAMLLKGGYAVAYNFPGLLWMQALLFGCGVLAAALAAMTSGILPFSSAALLPVAILFLPMRSAAQWPSGVEWIRGLIACLVVLATAGAVLFWQYGERRTAFSRVIGMASLALAALLLATLPPPLALWAQSLLSSNRAVGSSVQVALDLGKKQFFQGDFAPDNFYHKVWIAVPFTVRGLPPETEAKTDAVSLTFEWADGRTWHSSLNGATLRSNGGGQSVMDATALMDPALYRTELRTPMTAHGRLYLTVLGNRQSRTIPRRPEPVNIQDGLQCSTNGEFNHLICKSFFRWPDRIVRAHAGDIDEDFTNLISYSPFPAELNLYFGEGHFVGLPASMPQVTIQTMQPLAHFHRDFELTGVRLQDFIAKPPDPPR